MLNPLKASQAKICSNCLRRFYSQDICQLCNDVTCPNCNKCSCPPIEKIEENFKQENDIFNTITISNLLKSPLKSNLETQGILSSLEGQDLVKTRNGKLILSHYILSDGNKKIPFKIWGPLPRELYENRYATIKVKIKGVKLSRFNGQLQMVLQRNGTVSVLSYKQKDLHSTLEKINKN
ncbi:MAG: hypothetical protein ACW981_09195 [Candidatus Hodarchaeales archaeon]|jgi:hypothetical protein